MKMCELSKLEQEKWYAIAVGEIGIPPTEFYNLTTEEMRLAYKGYKQRQEDLGNIILLALNKSRTENKNDLFSFVEKSGYDIGNLDNRHKTFATLGIKEE